MPMVYNGRPGPRTGPLPDGDANDGVIGILRHHEVPMIQVVRVVIA